MSHPVEISIVREDVKKTHLIVIKMRTCFDCEQGYHVILRYKHKSIKPQNTKQV